VPGRNGEGQTTSPSDKERGSWKKTLLSVLSKIGWAAAGVLIAAFIGALLIHFGVLDRFKRPSVAEQLDNVRAEAARAGQTQFFLRELDLHGGGVTKSYFMVFRDTNILEYNIRQSYTSDEIRIYDLQGGKLTLRFRFQPDILRTGEGFSSPLLWRLTSVRDVSGDGVDEVVGAYSEFFMAPVFPAPVVIGWDPSGNGYQLVPLLTSDPRLANISRRGAYGRVVQHIFHAPYQLNNLDGSERLRAYPTEEFVIAGQPGQTLTIVAAYIARAQSHADERRALLELKLYGLNGFWPHATIYDCTFSPTNQPMLFQLPGKRGAIEPQLAAYVARKKLSCF
jgi:hypothetical protein